MPYNPGIEFNPNAALGAVAHGFGAIGEGIADMRKKKDEAEAQLAGATFGFNTLKQAGLIGPEEEAKFLSGNANQRNAIVMAATPRLLKQQQDKQMANTERHQMMQEDLQRQLINAQTQRTHENAGASHQKALLGQSDRLLRTHGIGVEDLAGVDTQTPFNVQDPSKTPTAVRYQNEDGKDVSGPEALALQQKGKGVFALAPGLPRVPLGKWNSALRYLDAARALSPQSAPTSQQGMGGTHAQDRGPDAGYGERLGQHRTNTTPFGVNQAGEAMAAEQAPAPVAPTAPDATAAVVAAFRSGQITRDEATKRLKQLGHN